MKATIVENPQTMNLKHALLASHQLRASIEKYRIQKDVHAAITQIMVSTPPQYALLRRVNWVFPEHQQGVQLRTMDVLVRTTVSGIGYKMSNNYRIVYLIC